MKKLLIPFFLLLSTVIHAQQLNNSWIDYTKTYYKFRLDINGPCRINESTLAASGLGSISADQFQLWRNGKQVPIYTSVASGAFGNTDYIEFLAKPNDGLPDKNLYYDTSFQLSDAFSLFNDTVAYFLTVNPVTTQNLRYTNSSNNTAGNTLPAENYFMNRVENPYQTQINPGQSVYVTEPIYSAAYDMGEGWTSANVGVCNSCDLFQQFNNLNVYTAGPANSVSLYFSAFGNTNAPNTVGQTPSRHLQVRLANNLIFDTLITGYAIVKRRIDNLPLSSLPSPDFVPIQIGIHNTNDTLYDEMVVATESLTYPAKFNFNNQKDFYFELPAAPNGNYLTISNFNNAAVAPVLYDMVNGYRYVGDISSPDTVKFVLPPSMEDTRKFMLVSEDPTNISAVSALTTRNFVNYNIPDSEGDYVIISNPSLYNDGAGNNYVQAYSAYRHSVAGGSYTPIIVSINELIDQFAFGISEHPASIRDFIISSQSWPGLKPKYVFIIGRGMTSTEYRQNVASNNGTNYALVQQEDQVPTFGWPASDVLLACREGQNIPLVPIGRLPAISGSEIPNYLQKIEDYEAAQASTVQTMTNKAWMKNFVHIAAGADSTETAEFEGLLNNYANIAMDTLMGAGVSTFAKSSTAYIEQASGTQISQLINNGLGFIGYFGHSAANTLEYNLGDPSEYQNTLKYPFFNVSGCAAGNFFSYDPTRVPPQNTLSISESWILAHQCGSIGFLADTYLGIPNFLDPYNTTFYNEFSNTMYGNTVGNQLKQVDQTLWGTATAQANNGGYYMRIHLEELNLDGDPALKINSFPLPDYDIEPSLISTNPSIISVADSNFTLSVKMLNIGKAITDSIRVTVNWILPNKTVQVLYNKVIPAILYEDSLNLTIPINPLIDKGASTITVTLNSDNRVQEITTANDSAAINFTIFEDDLNPVYPYNYSIINQQNITYSASSANPLSGQRQYLMQIDTSALFNSPFEKQYTASGPGGVIQFTPNNISYVDSTVYYWRVSVVPVTPTTPTIWNSSSFVYLSNSTSGFNQSHYYQFLNCSDSDITLGADRVFRFSKVPENLIIQTGLNPFYHYDQIFTELGSVELDDYGCVYNSLQVMVYDTANFMPWPNYAVGSSGRFGSALPTCQTGEPIRYFFEFPYGNPTYRQNLVNFLLDSIPNGMYISITNLGVANDSGFQTTNTSFISDWMGPGNSLYNTLKNIGFTKIDSFTRNLPFVYFYRKGVTSYPPQQVMGSSEDQLVSDTIPVATSYTSGTITSPLFGPAKVWHSLHWNGKDIDPGPGDAEQIQVYGVKADGVTQNLLATVTPSKDTSLAFINAATYPYIKLAMLNTDSVYVTPNQLTYWRVNGDYVPEGAVAPNILYNMPDTVTQGQVFNFSMAFKNVSPVAFADSLQTKFVITGQNNIADTFAIPKGKALISGDTLVVRDTINTINFPGNNTLYVMVNPYNDQPEQYLFNNSITQAFYVTPDKYDPTMDVTFDGIHILDKDIVSAKPHITIKLNDENEYIALSDTSLIKVQVYFPDPTGASNGTLVTYHFGDSMQFIPANLSGGQNVATINLIGNFPIDGQYELIVSGKDEEGNPAGNLEYRVAFNVINKTMISNLFNYPNPFTTSTAFVFTITGSVLPQNMRIQILTITGKVVKEITQSELGPLHVGDNITEYKWNGTDMYGQKLANGVYLYRVLTNLNGKSIENYNGTNANGDVISQGLNNASQYFTKGYGKMYLMR